MGMRNSAGAALGIELVTTRFGEFSVRVFKCSQNQCYSPANAFFGICESAFGSPASNDVPLYYIFPSHTLPKAMLCHYTVSSPHIHPYVHTAPDPRTLASRAVPPTQQSVVILTHYDETAIFKPTVYVNNHGGRN